jgi:hypothetical protein
MELFKIEQNKIQSKATQINGVWENALGESSSDIYMNVAQKLQTVNLTDVYDQIENDSKLKRDQIFGEDVVRLSDDLKTLNFHYTKNGLLTLNGFTSIPNAMFEYLFTKGYFADYASYANAELEKRADSKRTSKKFLLRFRELNSVEQIRGVMSDRYGIIDHIDVAKAVLESLPGGNLDCEVENYHNDGDTMGGNVIMPDYIKHHEDSDYSCGFHFGNSEIKRRTFTIKPYLYRAIYRTGYIWGRRDLAINVNMKHLGNISFDKIQSVVASGVNSSLSMGQSLIKLFEYAKDIPVDNGLRVIASLSRDYKLTTQIGKSWHKAYMSTNYSKTAFGIVNSLSIAAQEYGGTTRELMEMSATQMLALSIDTTKEQMQKRWTNINSKSQLLDAKIVQNYISNP